MTWIDHHLEAAARHVRQRFQRRHRPQWQRRSRWRQRTPTGQGRAFEIPLAHGTHTLQGRHQLHLPAIGAGAHQPQLAWIEIHTRLELHHQTGAVIAGAPDAHLLDGPIPANGAAALGCTGQIHPQARTLTGVAPFKKGLEVCSWRRAQFQGAGTINPPCRQRTASPGGCRGKQADQGCRQSEQRPQPVQQGGLHAQKRDGRRCCKHGIWACMRRRCCTSIEATAWPGALPASASTVPHGSITRAWPWV